MAKFDAWLKKEGLEFLYGWARDGLTDAQIAPNCGINRDTLNDWKKKFPIISDALKEGKEVVDLQVENALLKRALGYEYTETTTDESKKNGTTTKTVIKQMAPNVTAQIFWLKNWKREIWKDNHSREEIDIMRLQLEREQFKAEQMDTQGVKEQTIHVVYENQELTPEELAELSE